MDQKVKLAGRRRRYDGSRRQAAAQRTRQAIVAAGRQQFLERGYAATTMPAIAAAAGVALDTVYASVGPKPALFKQLVEMAISGAEEPVPALERDYVREIRAEPDPRRKLELYARAMRLIQERLAPLFRVLRDAAQVDPQLTALWEEISHRRASNMRMFAAELAAAGGLRQGVSVEEAADVVWVTNSPEFFLLLVRERQWDLDRFESWLAATWIRLLLP
ncbi:TetR family transcriptional regulator [Candidatus Nephthysia bennettiae]